jgi:hypothetical protein
MRTAGVARLPVAPTRAPVACRRGPRQPLLRPRWALLAVACAVFVTVGAGAPRAVSDRQQQGADRPADAGVRELLQQYSTALESLDAEAVKKVQPAIDLGSLKKAFDEMRALDVDIEDVKLLSGDARVARVSCRVTQTLTPKAGSKRTTTVTRVIRMRRADEGWVIDAFER